MLLLLYYYYINIHTDSPGYGTNIALLDGGRIAHTKYGSVFSQCLDDNSISILHIDGDP